MRKFAIEELIKCAEREVKQREFVYPRRVEAGKMTVAQMISETEKMKAIVVELRALAPGLI